MLNSSNHSQFEILHRKLVAPKDFLARLSWGNTAIAQELLRIALAQERLFTSALLQ